MGENVQYSYDAVTWRVVAPNPVSVGYMVGGNTRLGAVVEPNRFYGKKGECVSMHTPMYYDESVFGHVQLSLLPTL